MMPRLLTTLLLSALVLWSCSPGAEVGPREEEFRRHLRQGQLLIRRGLAEAAVAELEASSRLSPGHPDLLLQQARVELLQGRDEAAFEVLLALVADEPDQVSAHRLLFELERSSGNGDAAEAHAQALSETLGALGDFEMECYRRLRRGEDRIFFTESELAATGDENLDTLTSAFRSLRRIGAYAPGEGVPRIEDVLRRFPELAAVRLFYARSLVLGQIRVNAVAGVDVPPLSSELVLDMAQSHLEGAMDHLDPRSRPAREALEYLARIAESMADHEETLVFTNLLLSGPPLPSLRRAKLAERKAFALYKLDRFQESEEVLEELMGGDLRLVGLSQRWLLRLVKLALGRSREEVDAAFRLRSDLTTGSTSLSFEDVAPELGVNRLDGYGPNAWGDVDGDGDLDLFVSGGDSFCTLYRNDGDVFVDVTESADLGRTESGFSSTFVDVDNDGWLDLHIGRNGWVGPAPNTLFRNDGDGTFTDVTEKAGLTEDQDTFVHTWSDVDRDGDVDLYLARGITLTGATNVLFRNNGDGTFVDDTVGAGLSEESGTRTIGAAFGDYDRDGWPDLFVSGFETVNRLYHNRGDGTFEDVALVAGVDGIDHISTGYVCFVADLDNDGWPDLLRTSLAPWGSVLLSLVDSSAWSDPAVRHQHSHHSPRLYRNNGDGSFHEVSLPTGLGVPMGVMGAMVGDVDNDGWIDLYFGTGDPGLVRLEPDRFFHNNGDGMFTDLTFITGLGNLGKGHGVTLIDLDRDGDLEIYAAEGGMVHGDLWHNVLYLNNQSSGHHWLHVDLEGVESNRGGVDTAVLARAGELEIYREIRNGVGFGSSNSPTLELGLGPAAMVDRLEIRWPSGLVQVFEDVGADQRISIREGDPWQRWNPPGDVPGA